MHSVDVGPLPGWHIREVPSDRRAESRLDVLVPLDAPTGGAPQRLTAGESLALWADIHVPKGTGAGVHELTFEVYGGAKLIGAVEVELAVLPIVLPDATDVALIAGVDRVALFGDSPGRPVLADLTGSRLEQDGKLLRAALRLLQEHGLNPVVPDLAPRPTASSLGRPQLDWTGYDRVVDPLLSGEAFSNRVGLRHWPLPIAGATGGEATRSDPNLRPSPAFLRAHVQEVAAHFQSKGMLGRAYAVARADGDMDWHLVLPGDLARGFRVVAEAFPQDAGADGWVGFRPTAPAANINTWMPKAQFYDRLAMTEQRRKGLQTWMRMDRPPFSGTTSIHGESTDVRVLAWQAISLGASVVHLGVANPWPIGGFAASPQECADLNDRTLLYPGGAFGLDEPVASVRLKHLRRGMQDVAYLKLLDDHGFGEVAEKIVERISRRAGTDAYRTHFADGRSRGWPADETSFDLARQVCVDILTSHGNSPPATDGARILVALESWRRLMNETGGVELRVDGVRVRWRGAPPQVRAELEIAAAVEFFNDSPTRGALRWVDTHLGLIAQESAPFEVRFGREHRHSLRAEAADVPTNPMGILMQPVEWLGEDGSRAAQTARVAWTRAARTSHPPRIDGDLSDWAPGAGNVAGDFVSIADGVMAARRRTTTLIARDQQFLYAGVLCESGAESASRTSLMRRRGVHYDDLIPIDGEDLIELLIDPLNAGSRSPSDLLHILVKRSGMDLIEKGIATDPPCAERAPWAAEVQLATMETASGWSTEIRIPLSAIGDDPDPSAVWGFNVTRWDAQHQEFSSWSGARGNAYDPLSLGNLYVP